MDELLDMMASAYRRFAVLGGQIFHRLVLANYPRLRKRIAQIHAVELASGAPANFKEYLTTALDGAMQAVSGQFTDTDQLIQNLPEASRKWISSDVENQVRTLWPNRNQADGRSGIMFYKSLYEWLNAPETVQNWTKLYDQFVPNWKTLINQDWESELDVGDTYQPSMDEIFQHIQETGQEPTDEAIEEPTETQEDVQDGPGVQPPTEQAPEVQESRRPIEPELRKTLKILDPATRQKSLEVGVGDTVFNQTARQTLLGYVGSDEYPITRNQVNQYATGVIRDIREDGSILVDVPGAEQPFNEQIWDSTDKLWGSRSEGERLVQ